MNNYFGLGVPRVRKRSRRSQVVLGSPEVDQVHPVLDPRFLKNTVDMILNGLHRNEQRIRYLLIGPSLTDEFDDLPFSTRDSESLEPNT